ncbi:MAG: hypothetical protein ACRDTD_30025, partial [Pseudonocardiaceae bacterium]
MSELTDSQTAALKIARKSGSGALRRPRARTLRGISVLAVDLRHTSDALRLADAAPQAGPGECSRSSPANKRMPPRS